MKITRLLIALIAFVALVFATTPVQARNPLSPDTVLKGAKNELQNGSHLVLNGGLKVGNTAVGGTLTEVGVPFTVSGTITSAAAATAVVLLPEASVPAGKKVYVTGFSAKVNGATLWGTTATVKIQDTNGTPVDFATLAVAGLTANAFLGPYTANVTAEAAFSTFTGGTAAKGLQLKGNANGTGSPLVVTVTGIIK